MRWQFGCSYFDENEGQNQDHYHAKQQRARTDSPENSNPTYVADLVLQINAKKSYDCILVPVKSSSVKEQHGRLAWRK